MTGAQEDTVRKWLVLFFFFYSNLCKRCALLFTPDLWLLCSGNVTAVINCQTSTILVLEALPNKTV